LPRSAERLDEIEKVMDDAPALARTITESLKDQEVNLKDWCWIWICLNP
jgi:hypothetical protein